MPIISLYKGYTFHRNQYPCGERHHLGGASCGWILREELAIHFIDDTEVVAGHHENGCLYDVCHTAAGLFQNGFDVLKSLSGLIFEVVADNFPRLGVKAGCTGNKNEFFGYDGLRKGLAHDRGLGGIEVLSFSHVLILK